MLAPAMLLPGMAIWPLLQPAAAAAAVRAAAAAAIGAEQSHLPSRVRPRAGCERLRESLRERRTERIG